MRDRREPCIGFPQRATRPRVCRWHGSEEFADKLSDGSLLPFITYRAGERLKKEKRCGVYWVKSRKCDHGEFSEWRGVQRGPAGALAVVVFSLNKVSSQPTTGPWALWLLVLIKLLAPHVFNVPIDDGCSSPRRAVGAGLSSAAGLGDPRRRCRSSQGARTDGFVANTGPGGQRTNSRDLSICARGPSSPRTGHLGCAIESDRRFARCRFSCGQLAAGAVRHLGRGCIYVLGTCAAQPIRGLLALAVDGTGALVEDARAFAKQLGFADAPTDSRT